MNIKDTLENLSNFQELLETLNVSQVDALEVTFDELLEEIKTSSMSQEQQYYINLYIISVFSKELYHLYNIINDISLYNLEAITSTLKITIENLQEENGNYLETIDNLNEELEIINDESANKYGWIHI